jgi:hypothetical protein
VLLIEMSAKGAPGAGRVDPHIDVLDTMPELASEARVADSNDSGGTARAIFDAPKDGVFSVIALSLNRVPGDYTITIREEE